MNLFETSGAEFSPCKTYRYKLWRQWDEQLPMLNFLMLNPSTADEFTNDPTVERCERRARAGGYGGLVVTNLFALRSTDPKALYLHPEPVGGAYNNNAILFAAREAGMVIAAWGSHGGLFGRNALVEQMLTCAGIDLYVIKLTTTGPGHPLYVSYESKPVLWREGGKHATT